MGGANYTIKKCLSCGFSYLMASGALRCKSCRPVHAKAKRNTPAEIKKTFARLAVKKAVAEGKLIKTACEICGDTPTVGHHTNYNRPLDVQWLCKPCHAEAHHRLRYPSWAKTEPWSRAHKLNRQPEG